jgi:hypothetical protein
MTTTARREAECQECREVRELATKTECYRCYRARKRSDEAGRVVDHHNPGLRREHQKLLDGFHKIMSGARALGLSQADTLRVRGFIAPYVAPVQWALSGELGPEHELQSDVHVHQSDLDSHEDE